MKYLELMTSAQPATLKAYFVSCAKKIRKISRKHSIKKSILLNFVNLPAIFCPRLSEETHFYF